jgi:hypothetical protein
MYFEPAAIFFLIFAIVTLMGGLVSVFFKDDTRFLLIIVGVFLIVLVLVISMMTINYTVTGTVCKKTMWSESTKIQIDDKWYTLESMDDALSINSGDNVTIDVIEHLSLRGTYRGTKIISYVERVPIQCDTCKCNCSALPAV